MAVAVVWVRMALIGSYVWVLGPQLVKLFEKDWEVCPCRRRYITGGRGSLGFQKPSPGPIFSDQIWVLHYCSSAMPACHHPSLHDGNGLTSETISKPPVKCFLLKVTVVSFEFSLYLNRTVTMSGSNSFVRSLEMASGHLRRDAAVMKRLKIGWRSYCL